MRQFWWQFGLLLLWVMWQSSFCALLFPSVETPVAILALAVAWVAVAGFFPGFGWSLASVLIYDIVQTGSFTSFSLIALTLAYATSFVSRRIQTHGMDWIGWIYFLLGVVGGALYEFVLRSEWSNEIVWVGVLSGVHFLVVFWTVDTLHRWLKRTSMEEFRRLRSV